MLARGVRHWEIWNEEDLDLFFIGTPTDYARLLKVAYLAAKQADPDAVIVFGGLAHFQKPDWLDNVLDVIATDPMSTTYHGFMDVVATHNYFWAWQTFGHLYTDRTRLARHGLSNVKSWITEIGVPICGEGSFPACDDPQNRWYRASPSEQADFLIQSSTYAAWLNTQAYVWFQLFDDCGNTCGVDAYGLLRNDNTPRPAYYTYSLINDLLSNAQPYWRQSAAQLRPIPRQSGDCRVQTTGHRQTHRRDVDRYYTRRNGGADSDRCLGAVDLPGWNRCRPSTRSAAPTPSRCRRRPIATCWARRAALLPMALLPSADRRAFWWRSIQR